MATRKPKQKGKAAPTPKKKPTPKTKSKAKSRPKKVVRGAVKPQDAAPGSLRISVEMAKLIKGMFEQKCQAFMIRKHLLEVIPDVTIPQAKSIELYAIKMGWFDPDNTQVDIPPSSNEEIEATYSADLAKLIKKTAMDYVPYDDVPIQSVSATGVETTRWKRIANRPLSIKRFCRDQKINKRVLDQMAESHPDILDALETWDEMDKEVYLVNGTLGLYNAMFSKFVMMNRWGMRDKSDTTSDGKSISSKYETMSDDELEKELDTRRKLLILAT